MNQMTAIVLGAIAGLSVANSTFAQRKAISPVEQDFQAPRFLPKAALPKIVSKEPPASSLTAIAGKTTTVHIPGSFPASQLRLIPLAKTATDPALNKQVKITVGPEDKKKRMRSFMVQAAATAPAGIYQVQYFDGRARKWVALPHNLQLIGSRVPKIVSSNSCAVSNPLSTGNKLSFTSGNFGIQEIHLMNADGTNQTQLTQMSHDATGGAGTSTVTGSSLSPDGSKIAFTRFRGVGNPPISYAVIYVMNTSGSGMTRLSSTDQSYDVDPSWSPDGSQILFASYRDSDYEIYVMNADGSGQVKIATAPQTDGGHLSHPSW